METRREILNCKTRDESVCVRWLWAAKAMSESCNTYDGSNNRNSNTSNGCNNAKERKNKKTKVSRGNIRN